MPKKHLDKNTSESIRPDQPMVPQGAGTHEHDQNDGATKCNLDIHLPSQRYNIQMPHHAGDANYVCSPSRQMKSHEKNKEPDNIDMTST